MSNKKSTAPKPSRRREAARKPERTAKPVPSARGSQLVPDDRDHLKAIIDLAEDAVYIKDLRRRYLLVNPMAVKFLGRPMQQLLGKTDEQVFGETLSREVAAIDRAVIRTKKPVTYERRGQSAGKERVFLTTKVPYRDSNGAMLGLIGISREITQRKRMEEELAASEAKHRILLNSIQSPVLALDNDLTVVYCNKAYAAFVNKPVADLEGKNLLKAFPRVRGTKTYEAYQKVLETGRSRTVEGKMGDRYVSAQVFKTPTGLLAIAEDVTDRMHARHELERASQELEQRVKKRTESLTKTNQALQRESQQRQRTERALRDSDKKFRAILENSLDVITILNEDGIIKYANPSLTAVLGHDDHEIMGKSIFDFLHPSDIPKAIKALSELQQRPGTALTVELRLRHADGGWRILEVSGKYIPQTQILGGIVINARDVTMDRRALGEIRESEERQRILFDLAPEAYFVSDLKGALIDCNQSFERLTGLGKTGAVGRSLWDLGLVPLDQAPELTALLSRNATGSEAGPEEFVIATKGAGPLDVSITTHPVKIKGQPLVLGIITDNTATKQRRDQEKESFQELEFLSRTAMDFVTMDPGQDLFRYIAERLSEFTGGAIVGVNAVDIAANRYQVKAVAGLGALQPVVQKMLGFELAGKSFGDLPPDVVRSMSAARLDRLGGGLYDLFMHKLPAALCREVEKHAGITEVHAMGCVAKGRLIGSVAVLSRGGKRLGNTAVIETFVNQAAVAIERWLDEQQLRRDDVERQQSIQALKQSEEFARAIIDHSPLGIAVRDAAGQLISCNQAWRRAWGISDETVIRDIIKHHPGLTMENDTAILAGWRPAVQRIYAEGGSLYIPEVQISSRHPAGSQWAALYFYALRDQQGGVQRVIIVTEDISERKKAEQKLRRNEQHFRALIEHSSDVITILNQDGVIRYKSPSVLRELGYTPDELAGQNVFDLVHPDDAPAMLQAFALFLQNPDQVSTLEFRFRHKDGSWVVMSAVGQNLLHNPAVSGVVINSRNITDRKRAEQELSDSERRFRMLSDAADEGIAIHDQGIIIDANQALAKMFGYDLAEMIGAQAQKFATPETWELIAKNIARGCEKPYQGVGIRKDGSTFDCQLIGKPYHYQGRTLRLALFRDIAETKKAETALRESEERYRALSETSPDMIFTVDHGGFVRYINRTAAKYIGWEPEAVAGKHLKDLFPPDIYERQWRNLQSVLATGQPKYLQDQSVFQGHQFWLDTWLVPLKDDRGAIDAVMGISRDITAYKHADAALRESEQRYRSIFETAAEGIYRTTPEGRVLLANPALVRMLGYGSLDELLQRNISQEGYFDSAVRDEFRRRIEQDSSVRDFVSVWKKRDGSQLVVSENARTVRNDAGHVLYYEGTVEDITERKRAEDTLREREEQYRTLVENLDEVIFSVDAAGVMTYISPRIETMIGYRPEEVIGATFAQFIHPDDLPGLRASFERTLAGMLEPYEFRVKCKGGEFRYLQSSSRPTGEPGNPTGLNGVLSDISERKRTADALRDSEQRYRSLVENMADGVYRSTADGRFLDVNPAMVRIFGYGSREEMLAADIKRDLYFETVDRWGDYPEDGKPRTRELRMRRKDGSEIWVEDNCRYIRGASGEVEVHEGVLRDITGRKNDEEKIKYLTFHDRLTGLYNRAYYEEMISRHDSPEHYPLSLIMGDANGLKLVNDAFGHEAGDQFLRRIADIIRSCTRAGDLIFRWGGDEFVVLMPRTDNAAARGLCDAINAACSGAAEDPIRPSIALGAGTKDAAGPSLNALMMEAEDRMYRHKLVESKSLRSSIISSLGRTLWEADYETEEHALRLQQLAMEFGKSLKLTDSELNDLLMLAALHDIGKIAIADNILLKPSGLTDTEWEIVRKHPEIGFRIAQASPELSPIADGILAHHERWDGTGYPQGLRGEQIPVVARILSVIDSYDVMTQKRLYKLPISREDAIAELQKCAGSQFDPTLVDLFVKIITRKQP